MLSNTIRRAIAPLMIVAAVAACGGEPKTDAAARDIQLAPADSGAPMADTAMAAPAPAPTPAPETKAPAPAPKPVATTPTKAPAARSGTIAAGTSFAVTTAARMCTNTHKAGDTFTATLGADVTGTNGARIPAGSVVTLTVTESALSKNSKDNWKFAFDVVSVQIGSQTLAVEGDVTQVATIEAVRSQSTGQQVGKVATGAAVGAVAGQLLGKNTKSTVIGAAVGAAAGGAVAAGTADYEGCLPANGTITIAISKALTVPRA
ncbi:MAG: hypothetical protein KA761_14875 [Gemmatimonadaceae bacterium]|jgi:hypothetical protein|nr:hypothetical protein [Gemmatimonadaceae bacterium]